MGTAAATTALLDARFVGACQTALLSVQEGAVRARYDTALAREIAYQIAQARLEVESAREYGQWPSDAEMGDWIEGYVVEQYVEP